LRKYDPANKTAVMFYTDHGEYLGDHGVVEKWLCSTEVP
ncbi:MAG: hypothetical protein JWQ38_349, partial [Flavipsychrobacter sp.]|nr:hypothetical protein [Flavipsychrobacter sp.]